jgi:hypothetical protein
MHLGFSSARKQNPFFVIYLTAFGPGCEGVHRLVCLRVHKRKGRTRRMEEGPPRSNLASCAGSDIAAPSTLCMRGRDELGNGRVVAVKSVDVDPAAVDALSLAADGLVGVFFPRPARMLPEISPGLVCVATHRMAKEDKDGGRCGRRPALCAHA